jgi:hypothetical protein
MRPVGVVPILLILLALQDLRPEFVLLRDHFTWTALWFACRHHLLAVAVLLLSPSLLRRYAHRADRHRSPPRARRSAPPPG